MPINQCDPRKDYEDIVFIMTKTKSTLSIPTDDF